MLIKYSDQTTLGIPVPSEDGLILPYPLLGDVGAERFQLGPNKLCQHSDSAVWSGDRFTFGLVWTRLEAAAVDRQTQELYRRIFDLCGDRHLYRIWNYLPRINEGDGDAEIYKLFCEGRADAFHDRFGNEDETFMPAGTCVGPKGNCLSIPFLAGSTRPIHHENPQQVPAYKYPREYGVRSPSFARGTSALVDEGLWRFISGTSAVLGHVSVGPDDIEEQLRVTCENMQTVSAKMLETAARNLEGAKPVAGKVFLRRESDLSTARAFLQETLPTWGDQLIYMQSEICRSELLVEIELSYFNARAG